MTTEITMTTKTRAHLFIKLFVLISTFLIVLSSCDIIDLITDEFKGNDDELDTPQMEINDVIDIQNNAGSIIDNLFSTGLDTVAVKDSLASFFRNDDSVENVWVNPEGVAVEYKNGLRGGIFFSPFTNSNAGKLNTKESKTKEKQIKLDKDVVPLISPKKTILLDSSYEEFQGQHTVFGDSNADLEKIKLDGLIQKKDNDAKLSEYKNLSRYGIVHFLGHGWAWPVEPDKTGFSEVYLLTGEEVTDSDIVNNKYTGDEAKKVLLVGLYCYSKDNIEYKQNRVWISPQFISDNNTFNNDSTAVYGGFCYSYEGGWPNEIVNSAKAEVYVGYTWSVAVEEDAKWARVYYDDLCGTQMDNPMSVYDWYHALEMINDQDSYISYTNKKGHEVAVNYYGNKDFQFWKEDEPEILEFNKVCISYNLETDWSHTTDYVWQEWGFCFSPIQLNLSKSGNTYSGSYTGHSSWNPGSAYSGSITFTLKDDENTITSNGQTNTANSVEFTFKNADDSSVQWYELTITMTDVEYSVNNDGDIGLFITGSETCNHISFQSNNVDTFGTNTYTEDFKCRDNSKLTIGFSND